MRACSWAQRAGSEALAGEAGGGASGGEEVRGRGGAFAAMAGLLGQSRAI